MLKNIVEDVNNWFYYYYFYYYQRANADQIQRAIESFLGKNRLEM